MIDGRARPNARYTARVQRSKPEQDHTSRHADAYLRSFAVQPIGVVRSPYTERFGTPRQPGVTDQVKGDARLPGRIELRPEYAEGLAGLERFDRIWCLFLFHLNRGHGLTVRSPRDARGAGADEHHGLFSTRSPHRPCPIGLSCLHLTGIEGHVLHVLGLDILDHTPVLDIKPYLPYADAFPDARVGWLEGRVPDEADHFTPDRE